MTRCNLPLDFNHVVRRPRILLRLLSRETQEQVVDEGRELVADPDPVLVDQIVGGDVGVGPAEGLIQRIPLEG